MRLLVLDTRCWGKAFRILSVTLSAVLLPLLLELLVGALLVKVGQRILRASRLCRFVFLSQVLHPLLCGLLFGPFLGIG